MAPNPRTFFDIELDEKPLGRVVFELFADRVPRTVENFRVLCTGAAGISPVSGVPLCYEGSLFHRVIPQFMLQGGDFTKHNGTGGESIYGGTFADEDLSNPVDREGLLVMANRGKDTNGSQFFLTMAEAPHLNGKHVVFGRVVSGFEHLRAIEALPTDAKDRPLQPARIVRSGELQLARKPVAADEERGRSVSRSRSASPVARRGRNVDDNSRSRSRSPSLERSSRRPKKARRSPSTSASSSSSRSRSPPRRKHKSSKAKPKSKRRNEVPPAEERRDARGIPLDRDETDAEIDARLEREDMERREQEKRAREEALKRRLKDDQARERERANGGVQYKGRGTMRYTEDRPTPDLPSYSRSYQDNKRGPRSHADRGANSGTREREIRGDRWTHDRAVDDIGARQTVQDRFVKARRAEAERGELSEAGRALAGRIGRSADDPPEGESTSRDLRYDDDDDDDRPRRSASPPSRLKGDNLAIRGSASAAAAIPLPMAIGGVDEIHVSKAQKDEVRQLELGDNPTPAGGGMRSWD